MDKGKHSIAIYALDTEESTSINIIFVTIHLREQMDDDSEEESSEEMCGNSDEWWGHIGRFDQWCVSANRRKILRNRRCPYKNGMEEEKADKTAKREMLDIII